MTIHRWISPGQSRMQHCIRGLAPYIPTIWAFGSTRRQTHKNASRPNAPTPFNGEHNTGIQVLNTSNFPDDHGPLRNLRADARTTGLVSVRGCCVSFWSPAY